MIYQTIVKTPIGPVLLTANNDYLLSLDFTDQVKTTKLNDILKMATDELLKYLDAKTKKFSVPLHLEGTEFQQKCWKTLMTIPFGKTISYKEQALRVKNQNYCRGVAHANNKNPLPIFIPCHRVIGSNGSLVGYSGGIELKKYLLDLEKKCRD